MNYKKWIKSGIIGLIAAGGVWVSPAGAELIEAIQVKNLGQILNFANSLSLPHTFQSDQPAKASEINANFKSLLDALNNNFRFEETPKTVDVVGHIRTLPPTGGKAPTLAQDCAAVASITGTDTAGAIKFSGVLSGGCQITFFAPFSNPPACIVSSDRSGLPLAVYANKENFTVWSNPDLSKNPKINYICLGL